MNNIAHLRQAELRLSGLSIHNPESSEFRRFKEVIVPELKSKLTATEKLEYDQLTAGKTPEQIKKETADAIRQMNENRDKPSI